MKIAIKNMVCPCCVLYVKKSLADLGMPASEFSFGVATLDQKPSEFQLNALEAKLKIVGLEIVTEKKNNVVEQIKTIVRDLVNMDDSPLKVNLSTYLSEQLGYNYSYLSNLFSESEGQTIRDYGITLRIERVKQMLIVEQLDLLEISVRLNYSSVAHLASQFKKTTGLTTTEYKKEQYIGVYAPRMAS